MLRILLIIISLVDIQMISLRRQQTYGYNAIERDKQHKSYSTSEPIALKLLSNFKPINRKLPKTESNINKNVMSETDHLISEIDVKPNQRTDNNVKRFERQTEEQITEELIDTGMSYRYLAVICGSIVLILIIAIPSDFSLD